MHVLYWITETALTQKEFSLAEMQKEALYIRQESLRDLQGIGEGEYILYGYNTLLLFISMWALTCDKIAFF